MFALVLAMIRARFVEFCSDGKNAEEAVKLGLAVARPPVKEEKKEV